MSDTSKQPDQTGKPRIRRTILKRVLWFLWNVLIFVPYTAPKWVTTGGLHWFYRDYLSYWKGTALYDKKRQVYIWMRFIHLPDTFHLHAWWWGPISAGVITWIVGRQLEWTFIYVSIVCLISSVVYYQDFPWPRIY